MVDDSKGWGGFFTYEKFILKRDPFLRRLIRWKN
jgi:hypothetical protein